MSDDRYILDGKSFVDTKTNQCLNFGVKDLARVTITLNNMDMWLNQAEERIAELEEQLKNAIVPKFKYHQVVYALCNSDIIKGQIDCFDYYNKKYLIWTMDFGLGNEWCYEHELFATKEEAEERLKNYEKL